MSAAEVSRVVRAEMARRFNYNFGTYHESRQEVEDSLARATSEQEKLELTYRLQYLDAVMAELRGCMDAFQSGITATWEPDGHSWRVSYTYNDREIVYRWFERLEEALRLEVVDGCQTIRGYQEWRSTVE